MPIKIINERREKFKNKINNRFFITNFQPTLPCAGKNGESCNTFQRNDFYFLRNFSII